MFCPLIIVVYVSNFDRIFHISYWSKMSPNQDSVCFAKGWFLLPMPHIIVVNYYFNQYSKFGFVVLCRIQMLDGLPWFFHWSCIRPDSAVSYLQLHRSRSYHQLHTFPWKEDAARNRIQQHADCAYCTVSYFLAGFDMVIQHSCHTLRTPCFSVPFRHLEYPARFFHFLFPHCSLWRSPQVVGCHFQIVQKIYRYFPRRGDSFGEQKVRTCIHLFVQTVFWFNSVEPLAFWRRYPRQSCSSEHVFT